MTWKSEKHPLNAKGKYYVDRYTCLDHECCVEEAPDNFKMEENSWSAYVFKQPKNAEEELKCQEAIKCCSVEAIRNDGETNNQ